MIKLSVSETLTGMTLAEAASFSMFITWYFSGLLVAVWLSGLLMSGCLVGCLVWLPGWLL